VFHGFSPAKDDPNAWEYHADMAYSAASFRDYLPRAADVAAFEDHGHTLSHTLGTKKWTITLGPERYEGIALLKMARMTMHLRLEGYPRVEADHFLDRFLKHYLRGGG
jgi:hypothetical protein